MDRVSQLAEELNMLLDRLHEEAVGRDMRSLMAPLAWLDEANGWLRHELTYTRATESPDTVAFTYIPVQLRK
ncbi:MAG: hypothetical protein WEB52_06670 [Dehalococcoidia bacterium]